MGCGLTPGVGEKSANRTVTGMVSCSKCPECNSRSNWFLPGSPRGQSWEGFSGQGTKVRIARPLGKKLGKAGTEQKKTKNKTEDPM